MGEMVLNAPGRLLTLTEDEVKLVLLLRGLPWGKVEITKEANRIVIVHKTETIKF
jgi:hypothetical protein